MLLETCRYKFVGGKVITKMFGMKGNDWDIEAGWCHSPKDAIAAIDKPTTLSAIKEAVEVETVKASRFARVLADDLQVDLSKVTGTGKDGVITKDDITNYYNSLEA